MERENARPQARPPTSNANGMLRMMDVRKTTDENTLKIHMSSNSAQGAYKDAVKIENVGVKADDWTVWEVES